MKDREKRFQHREVGTCLTNPGESRALPFSHIRVAKEVWWQRLNRRIFSPYETLCWFSTNILEARHSIAGHENQEMTLKRYSRD